MDTGESKRYYPQQAELSILNGSIAQYFSYAERSPERSTLANDISAQLQKISPHWTKRAVRLWFNNNKNNAPGKLPSQDNEKDEQTFGSSSSFSLGQSQPNVQSFQQNSSSFQQGPFSNFSMHSNPMMSSSGIGTPLMPIQSQSSKPAGSGMKTATLKPPGSSTKSSSTNRTATLAGMPSFMALQQRQASLQNMQQPSPMPHSPLTPQQTPNQNSSSLKSPQTPIQQPPVTPPQTQNTQQPQHSPQGSLSLPQNPSQPLQLNQTMTASLAQSMNQSLNHSMAPSLNQTMASSLNQSMSSSLNQTMSSSLNQSMNSSLNQTMNSSLNQTMSSSLNQSMNSSLNQSMSSSLNQTMSSSLNQSMNSSQRPNVHFNPIQTPSQPSIPSQQTQSMPNPRMQPAKSLSAWPQNPMANKSLKAEYQRKLKAIVAQNKSGQQTPEQLKQSATEFESICQQMHNQQINFALEGNDQFQSIDFPSSASQKDPSSSFMFDSNGNPIWQPRKHNTQSIVTFDTTYNGRDFSMYVHSIRTSPKRAVTFSKNNRWTTIPLNSSDHIEACVGEQDFCFTMTPYALTVVNLTDPAKYPPQELQLSSKVATIASICLGGNHCALGGLGSAPTIYYVTGDAKVTNITPESIPQVWGISAMGCVNETASDGICVAFSQSPVLRVYNSEGRTIRSLIGHTETTDHIKSINNMILTASEDKTAKIWDMRSQAPVMSIKCDQLSIHNCCLSNKFALLCLEDRSVCVNDIRGVTPVLGVRTDEYAIESPFYNEEKDKLTMFGVASKDGINDSLLFLNDNMESTKYVYRQYIPFVSSLIL